MKSGNAISTDNSSKTASKIWKPIILLAVIRVVMVFTKTFNLADKLKSLQAEVIRKAAEAYNKTKLTPKVKKFFTMWLNWQRKGVK